jgi:uncharacterized membrane protein
VTIREDELESSPYPLPDTPSLGSPTRSVGARRVFAAIAQRPALVAFLLALLGGLAIAVLTPPFSGADEGQHFTRAYQLSRADILTHKHQGVYGAYLPHTFLPEFNRIALTTYKGRDKTAFLRYLGDSAPHGPSTFVSTADAASYGPGAYVAYAPAIAIGRALNLSLLSLLYLARFAGVIFYAGVLALAVRRLPIHKWTLLACGLIPAALNQASTVTADGATMVLTFLLVAEAVRLAVDPPLRARGLLIEIGVAAALLALAKPPYVAFVVLLLWPAWKYRATLARPLIGIVAGALVLASLWGFYQSTHSISQANPALWIYGNKTTGYAFHNLAVGRQTKYVVTHPFGFLAVIGRTFAHQGITFPKQLFGQLALYQLGGWLVVLCVAVVLFAGVAANDSDPKHLPVQFRILLVVVTLGIGLAIFAIGYTNWNAYHAPRIDALPPRYFLPLIPPLLIGLLPSPIRRLSASRLCTYRVLVAVGMAVLLGFALVGLHHYHFSGPPVL